MRTKRWLMALVPLVVLAGSLPAQDATAQKPGPPVDEQVDALISIDNACKPAKVTPDPIKVQRGNKIRWGVTSECPAEVTVSIQMKDAERDPLEDCSGNRKTKKEKHKPGKPITCKVKSGALGKYGYSVSADGNTLDPEIEVRE